MIFKNLDVRLLGNRVQQRALDLAARDVLGMQDSSLGMAAFPAKIEFVCAMGRGNFPLGKLHPQFNQFLYPRRAFPDNRANDAFLAQACTRHERVAHVRLERIFLARHRCNTALGIIRVRLRTIFFVTIATRPCGATFKANVRPAMPLPRTR